jgi:hypothetical protein
MPTKRPAAREHVHYHKDGSIWARGPVVDGVMSGYWEWYRKDGTRMRSGQFESGEQVGEWTTYDKAGAVVKVTLMKPKAPPAKPKPAAKSASRSPAARSRPKAK